MGTALAQKFVRVPGLSGDLESGLDEQSSDPLAQPHVVLADHEVQRI